MIGNDTALKFIAVADTAGRFVMTTLPPGTLRLRAYVDANANRVLDPREQWDSATVTLADTASREFYMFAHDTIGPSLLDVTPIDSVTLRVRFDRPLLPGAPLEASQFSLKMKDSTKTDSVLIAVLRVSSAARFDTLTQQRKAFVLDSTMRADTSVLGRKTVQRQDSLKRATRQDSIAQAQRESVRAARDTVKPVVRPKPARPAPLSEFIVELGQPLLYDVFATLSVRDAVGLTGHTHRPPRVKQVVIRKPPRRTPRRQGCEAARERLHGGRLKARHGFDGTKGREARSGGLHRAEDQEAVTADPRRSLPAVGTLLELEGVRRLLATAPRDLVTDVVRSVIEHARQAATPAPVDDAAWVRAIEAALVQRQRSTLRRVINATGVVLHTNLGRAPPARRSTPFAWWRRASRRSSTTSPPAPADRATRTARRCSPSSPAPRMRSW